MSPLSKATNLAIEAFKDWSRAKARYEHSLASGRVYTMRSRELEKADARLSLAVVEIPRSEFTNYVTITARWDEDQ